MAGHQVIEIGCGAGDNTAALAAAGATVIGVDVAPAMIRRARIRWDHHPGARLVTAEAGAYLTRSREPVDVICSIFGALSFSRPFRLLPLVAARLRAGGRLAFSTRVPPGGRGSTVAPAQVAASGARLPSLARYTYDSHQWRQFLIGAGFAVVDLDEIHHPGDPSIAGCLIVSARLRSPPGRTSR